MLILRFDLSFIIYAIILLAHKKSSKKGAKFTVRFEIMFTNAWIIPKPFFYAGCNTKPTLAGLVEDDNIGTLHGTMVHFVTTFWSNFFSRVILLLLMNSIQCKNKYLVLWTVPKWRVAVGAKQMAPTACPARVWTLGTRRTTLIQNGWVLWFTWDSVSTSFKNNVC